MSNTQFFSKPCVQYANSVFTHSVVLKCERIDLFMLTFSVGFCKFPPKPLPLTAYQEFEIRYALSKLKNCLINCFNVSRLIIVFDHYFIIQLVPIALRFKYQTTILRSKAKFFVSSTLVAATFRKSGIYLIDQSDP